jgi:cytochrome c peroxidase
MKRPFALYFLLLSALAASLAPQACGPGRRGHAASAARADALVALGQRLFFDTRLSANGAKSCSSCHDPAFAFSDGYRQSVGLYGDAVPRNAPSLLNARFFPVLGWADTLTTDFVQQMQRPLYGQHPPEMGLSTDSSLRLPYRAKHINSVLLALEGDSLYPQLFRAAFPGHPRPFGKAQLEQAIAAYENTLVAMNAPYDRYQQGDATAISPTAQQGLALFLSPRLACAQCHAPPLFSDGKLHRVHGPEAYASKDRGLYDLSGRESDLYRFRTPSLRNVARTAPYLHDGSAENLNALFDRFARHGHGGPALQLQAQERQALLLFLETLTDLGNFAD